MLGLAVVLLLFMILAAGPYDLANIFYFPLAGGWIGGRFLQRLEVEDPLIHGTGLANPALRSDERVGRCAPSRVRR